MLSGNEWRDLFTARHDFSDQTRIRTDPGAQGPQPKVPDGDLLLDPRPPVPAVLDLQVQGHHRGGSAETLAPRVSQCFSPWRSTPQV